MTAYSFKTILISLLSILTGIKYVVVQDVHDNVSVADDTNYSVSFTDSLVPTGYTLKRIVGFRFLTATSSGKNRWRVKPYRMAEDYIRFHTTAAIKAKIVLYGLCRKD